MILAARVALSVLAASGVTWVAENVAFILALLAYFAVDATIEAVS